LTKIVPFIGSLFFPGITYFTFQPMGHRLADVFKKNLDGEYDIEMVVREELKAKGETILADDADYTVSNEEEPKDPSEHK